MVHGTTSLSYAKRQQVRTFGFIVVVVCEVHALDTYANLVSLNFHVRSFYGSSGVYQ